MPKGVSGPSSDVGYSNTSLRDERCRLWHAPAAEDLLWLDSREGEAVVFDRRSAQTHLLNPQAAAALRILMRDPADPADLARALALAIGLETAASRDLASEILEVFDKLGLVEPAGL